MGRTIPKLHAAESIRHLDAQQVHRGRDGWLFLTGGSNHALAYYTRADAFTDAMVRDWTALLQDRARRCRELGITYVHMIVPEKLTIYFDKFAGDLPFRSRSPALRLPQAARAAGLERELVDLVPDFLRRKRRHQLFWKTDTHWTFEGCLVGYRVLCDHLDLKPNAAITRGGSEGHSLLLDLGGQLGPPVAERFVAGEFIRNARRVSANPIVSWKERHGRENDGHLHVGSSVVFCNFDPRAVGKCVLLFGDSFSEYRPHLLTGMLAETVRELHFVWSSNVDWNHVRRVRPDILVTQFAERFAARVPADDFDLDRTVIRSLAPLIA